MPVSPFSRYAGLPTLQVTDSRGRQTKALAIRRPLRDAPVAGIVHQVVGRETVDLIARRYYNREDSWWQLMDGNPLRFPLDLRAGEGLVVPAPRSLTSGVSREQRSR